MSTLNIIRNKVLARIFAVALRRTEYVDLHKYAALKPGPINPGT